MAIASRLTLAVAALFAGIGAAQAAPSPVGQWTVTFFVEPNLTTAATQNICLSANQTWYSSTFHGWKGYWFQDGVRLRWNGSTGLIATGAFGHFDSPALQSGESGSWFATTGAASSPGTSYSMRFSKSVCDAPAAASARASAGGDPLK